MNKFMKEDHHTDPTGTTMTRILIGMVIYYCQSKLKNGSGSFFLGVVQ